MMKYFYEFIGTFALVFAGTGAVVINDFSQGAVTHVGISLTFGLVVMAVIYAIGDLSGAHINPAVSIAFWCARRLAGKDAVFYVVSQFCGGLAASFCLKIFFPLHKTLGATLPFLPVGKSFLMEMILTFILMFVIIHVATGAKEKGMMAGVAVGATVCLSAMFAGPVTGASMNPARSLGPALASHHLENLWIYLSAPILGAVLAVVVWRNLNKS